MRNYGITPEYHDEVLERIPSVPASKRPIVIGFTGKLRENEEKLQDLKKQKVLSEKDKLQLSRIKENIVHLVGLINEQILLVNKHSANDRKMSIVVSDALSEQENQEIIIRQYEMDPDANRLLENEEFVQNLKQTIKKQLNYLLSGIYDKMKIKKTGKQMNAKKRSR